MVTLVKYVRDYTGINLLRGAHAQSMAEIDTARANQRNSSAQSPLPTGMEVVYDAVVGIDRIRHCGFDRTSNAPARLGIGELVTLFNLAQKIRKRNGGSTARETELKEISYVATKYIELLEGKREGISKQLRQFGTRHTLLRGENGGIFEIANSMTEGEIERFRRKTNMRVMAVEKPEEGYSYQGRTEEYKRIVLGEGGFGKVRIARNIATDQYVAVKKTHADCEITSQGELKFVSAQRTNFSKFSPQVKRRLKNTTEAVIIPYDERTCLSQRSKKIREMLDKENTGHVSEHQIKTIYSFSELGIANISDAIKTLEFATDYFSGIASSRDLSALAIDLLTRYAETYGRERPGCSATTFATMCRNDGMALFDLEGFLFKSPQRLQQFRNTLGRDVTRALATLNNQCFAHNDIKPPNVVLTQNPHGAIAAKLIDIDLIQDGIQQPQLPTLGTPHYLPPEAHLQQASRFTTYDAAKGDAYALGLSLREIGGHSEADVIATAALQMKRAGLAMLREVCGSDRPPSIDLLIMHIENEIQQAPTHQSVYVKEREMIPVASSLIDVADLMLQVQPRCRLNASQALALPFFKNANNFLSTEQFSQSAKVLVRISGLLP